MIEIVVKNAGDKIQQIKVSGHADSAKYGYDIVCAAVTGITTGAMNAIDQKFPNETKISVLNDQSEIIIEVTNLQNNDLQIMLEMLKVQLSTIWIQYQENIKIKEVH